MNKKLTWHDANIMMNPERLGAMHQTRMSFARVLINKMAKEKWRTNTIIWDLSDDGYGKVIYQVDTPDNTYYLVIFSDQIEDSERNDRVIAEKWDVTFALVKAPLTENLIKELKQNVPLQEQGRNPSQVLVLARANKSVRFFSHVLISLSQGNQPDISLLNQAGYLLRTTAVYGNGKFGITDYCSLAQNKDFSDAFSAQMLSVYLLKDFSIQLVEFLAKKKSPSKACELESGIKRHLGIGNATGLGMAPYLITHPNVVDHWISIRDMAISEVCKQSITKEKFAEFIALLKRSCLSLKQTLITDEAQNNINTLCIEQIESMVNYFDKFPIVQQVWGDLVGKLLTEYHNEVQEIAISCLLEIYPDIADSIPMGKAVDESLYLDESLSVAQFKMLIEDRYQWAIDIDFNKTANNYWLWYRSLEKEEPRMGVRANYKDFSYQLPLDIAKQVNQLYQVLCTFDSTKPLVEFLLSQPQFRFLARRVYTLANKPMGDIQINVLAHSVKPINLLRCKLAILGATRFDPKSDRWVRVTFFQGAPLLDEVSDVDWLFPVLVYPV